METDRLDYRDPESVTIETFDGYNSVTLTKQEVLDILHGFDEQDNDEAVSVVIQVRIHDGWWTDDGDNPAMKPDFSKWTDDFTKNWLSWLYPDTNDFLTSGGIDVSVRNPHLREEA